MDREERLVLRSVTKKFPGAPSPALCGIDAVVGSGRVTGIAGPDGAGKTTLLRIIAGLLSPSSGGLDIPPGRISYMPQKFGLYEDLTVGENLGLYSDLHGVSGEEKARLLSRLLAFTGLEPFTGRHAGDLSGGMKQKLGLACCLISRPRLLLLDEPSVGVDPVSRRELWKMVGELAGEGITVLWSTAYLDEAERCAEVLVLNEGNALYKGPPSGLSAMAAGSVFLAEPGEGAEKRRFAIAAAAREDVLDSVIQGSRVRVTMKEKSDVPPAFDGAVAVKPAAPRFEDSFMKLIGGVPKERLSVSAPSARRSPGGAAVEARNLTKKFGRFTAVDDISFTVGRGEVFGLLGPNGAGKSTTFKMMCGLMKATSGKARVAGVDLVKARAGARERLGYMAQKFSLYGDLRVIDNLAFFGGVYGLRGKELEGAVSSAVGRFQLEEFVSRRAGELPLGFKQRLSMACATMHSPEILFLDEPTSGVDPVTRREFWGRINAMVEEGVSVVVTTHFMDEAEYCDRIALIHSGRIIACDTPDAIKRGAESAAMPEPTLEDAFIEMIRRGEAGGGGV